MRWLLPPDGEKVDLYAAYRPADPSARLLRINMVASLDGHVVDAQGVSGSLGGEGDRQVFGILRAQAHAVMAGAGTVRTEGYGPMRPRADLAASRHRDGLDGPVPIVVVTRSMRLDLDAPLFTEAVAPTMVVTTTTAPQERVASVQDAGGIVVAAGADDVDLAGALRIMREEHGIAHVLCEGGPSLNGRLLAEGLVDEVCLTLAPTLTGGDDARRIVTGLAERRDLRPIRVLEHEGELLLTYARR